MNFVIVSHASHKEHQDRIYAYEPYIRELNLWIKYVDKVTILAPLLKGELLPIEAHYKHHHIEMKNVTSMQLTSVSHALKTLLVLPKILFAIVKAFKTADHIHLRCPGNLGLLGCIVQIFFPKVPKTAKYAGNWDPSAKQPWSYKLQKWILGHTVLTKNMTVLVYGAWEKQSKNIKPFFTASFSNSDVAPYKAKPYDAPLKFVFTGSIVEGKRPDLAVKIIQKLIEKGIAARLELYGEGILRQDLEAYILKHKLEPYVFFKGNQPLSCIKDALQKAHFLILPSKSEGWPKAVAEAMFFGVIPIATAVSCVPSMLDNGHRGIIIAPSLETAADEIMLTIEGADLNKMAKLAQEWSQKYTLEYFETEIKKLLENPCA